MLHRSVEPDESDLLDFHQLWAADENRAAIYRRLSAHPLDRLEGGRCKLLTVPNFFEDSLGEGVLGTGLDGRGDRKGAIQALVTTIALGASFTCIQAYEYAHAPF